MVRYAYDESSNAWLEVQWYMFAVIVMFGASYTLKRNEHVRVDIFYMTLGRRGQLWVDILGTLSSCCRPALILAWLSWPFFMQSYNVRRAFLECRRAGALADQAGAAGRLRCWSPCRACPS